MSAPTDHIDFGELQALLGLAPAAGDTYLNVHTGDVGTVVKLSQRRYLWITMRSRGVEREMSLSAFGAHWLPCGPSGVLR